MTNRGDLPQLFSAVSDQDAGRVGALLEAGADVHARYAGYTALMRAASMPSAQVVAVLLDRGADIRTTDSDIGVSPLHLAAQGGSVSVVRLLVERGAAVNQQVPSHGFTALMNAVWHRHRDVVEYLLGLDEIDVEIVSALGLTAGQLVDELRDTTGLSESTAKRQNEEADALAALFDAHQPGPRTSEATTRLMDAVAAVGDQAAEGRLERVRQAIADGADVDARYPVAYGNNDGYTPLLVAARDGDAVVVDTLLSAGADITLTCGHMWANPAHKAAYRGQATVMRRLAAHPQFARISDAQGPYNGYTPLIDATWHGHGDTVRALLDAGADPSLAGLDGATPRILAERYGYHEIAAMLPSP